jgi:hypothetical protein
MELITYSHILLSIGFLLLTTITNFLIFNSKKYVEAMLFKSQSKSNKKLENFVTYVDQPSS